jgi:hypothetical protein
MGRKAKKYHFIYKTTNILSGKYYIGMHSTDDLDDGYLGSGRRLRYSINKYGKENHKLEIMEFVSSREELKEREKEIVNLNEIAKEECMNLVVGGQGGFSIESTKKGREITDDILRKKYGDNFRSIISTKYHNKLRNDPDLMKEHGKKIKNGQDKSGFNRMTFLGKKHTEETKINIGEKSSKHQKGEGNSQYGTCWITKESINKKIKKEELPKYQKEGWVKGRKLKK